MKKITVVFILAFGVNCYASVPRLIDYAGKLTNASGQPLTGAYSMIFTLYDAETAGSVVWQETQPSVSVSKGVFACLLGQITPFADSFNFNQPYWLSVNVQGEGEMSPRQRLASVVYSLNADSIDGLHASNSIQANALLPLDSSAKFPLSVCRVPMVFSGCGDIDANTSERCYLNLPAVPSSIVIYLYGERFSPFHYTEVGLHNHTHSTKHKHYLGTSGGGSSSQLSGNPIDSWWAGFMTLESPGATDNAGVGAYGPISTSAKVWLNAMEVWLDNDNRTSSLLGKLAGWTCFGNGASGHPLCSSGTGPVDITDLTIWTAGQHYIEFKHPSAGGGKIRYYIYVLY